MPIRRLSPELIQEISSQYKLLSHLNLSDNEIAVIENIEPLDQLERLTLSNNRIGYISGIRHLNATLRYLNLSNNRIRQLDGLEDLRHVEVLDFSNNYIDDIIELSKLLPLQNLVSLNLEGNPVCSQHNYRSEVVKILMSLVNFKYLDGKEVTEAEKKYIRLSTADKATDITGAQPSHVAPQTGNPYVQYFAPQFQSASPPSHHNQDASGSSLPGGYGASVDGMAMRNGNPYQANVPQPNHQYPVQQPPLPVAQQDPRNDVFMVNDRIQQIEQALAQARDNGQKLYLLQCLVGEERQLKTAARHDVLQSKEREERLASRVRDLEAEMEKVVSTKDGEVQGLQAIVAQLETKVEEEENKVKHLRTYISSGPQMSPMPKVPPQPQAPANAPVSASVSRDELERSRARTRHLEEQIEALKNQLELADVRYNAMKEVLSAQEKDIAAAASLGASHIDLEKSLLAKWREKVYSLIVQSRVDEKRYSNIVKAKDIQIAEMAQQIRIRDKEMQKLESLSRAKTAEAAMEATGAKFANSTLKKVEGRQKDLEDKLETERMRSSGIASMVNSMFCDFFSENITRLHESFNSLNAYQHRLEFAVGRIQTVRNLQIRQTSRYTAAKNDSLKAPVVEEGLRQELAKVTAERNALSKQLSEDASIVGSKVANAQREVQKELDRVRDDYENTKGDLQRLVKELERAGESSKNKDAALERLEDELEQQKRARDVDIRGHREEKARLVREIERAADAARLELEEELGSLRLECNSLKTKTTQLTQKLKQSERAVLREKERSETEDRAKFESLEDQLARKDAELRSVRRERNTLLSTMRQQDREASGALRQAVVNTTKSFEKATPTRPTRLSNDRTEAHNEGVDEEREVKNVPTVSRMKEAHNQTHVDDSPLIHRRRQNPPRSGIQPPPLTGPDYYGAARRPRPRSPVSQPNSDVGRFDVHYAGEGRDAAFKMPGRTARGFEAPSGQLTTDKLDGLAALTSNLLQDDDDIY